MLDQVKLAINTLLPKKWLTELAGWGAERQGGWLTNCVINLFVRYYKVNMEEARYSQTKHYKTFNDFFTRPLRENVRPVDADPNVVVLPADGAVSQCGTIEDQHLFQAKGRHYPLTALLAGDEARAEQLRNGSFITTYLAPRNYHRVHMPCDGVLREMVYVPGDLYSVNPLTAANINNLFARNERVICYFDTDKGPIAQILVGAIIVGSIETSWAGTINPKREGIIQRWRYPTSKDEGAIMLQKGDEMGRFKLGSTVITLFPANTVNLNPALAAGTNTCLGQPLATFSPVVPN